MKPICLAILCVGWLGLAVYGRVFDPHHEYHYTYSAHTQTWLDHEITTIIKLRVHYINETASGKHLMKLFVDSFWQRDDQGHVAANPKKWNLAIPFFFTMTRHGLVDFVHVHPEEHEELLILKKAVVSVFSAHVEPLEVHEYEKEYYREEADHQGHNGMDYRVERVGGGHRVTRQHSSDGRAERYHDKTLHFNGDNDIHLVYSNDKIVMQDRTPEIRGNYKQEPMPGEKIIDEVNEGEFPTIHVIANSTLTLSNKKAHQVAAFNKEKYKIMKKDSIIVQHNETKTSDVPLARKKIDEQLICMRKVRMHISANKSECLVALHTVVRSLTDPALATIGQHFLNVSCGRAKVSEECLANRLILIDSVGSVDSEAAQRILLWYVLKRPRSEEEIQKVLTHLISMTKPYPAMVAEVEKMCFGEKFEAHGRSTLEELQKKACLVVGAVSKNLNVTDPLRAAQLMQHIESWLLKHAEKHGRYKRDVTIDPLEDEGYYAVFSQDEVLASTVEESIEMTRVILLESLGNAGLQRSLPHLMEHAQPDIGKSSWRRAALHAMRTYGCDESATAILESALHDSHQEVRVEALDQYKLHPKAFELSLDQEEVIARRNVSIDMLSRQKRSDLEEILCSLSFFIQAPGVRWVKEVGSKAVGASIGIILQNEMLFDLSPLSGQFKVEVRDEGWAEVHIGFLKLFFDIFRVRLCFKGHIRYDLNVLKNFGIDEPQELLTKFDQVVKSVTDPVIIAVDNMLELMARVAERGIIGMVNDLIQSTVDIHSGMLGMVIKVKGFKEAAAAYQGMPWMRSVHQFATRTDNTMVEVMNSYSAFYQAIGNDLLVTLPSAVTDVFDALMGIVTAVQNIFDNPLGVLSSIANAVQKVRMGMAQVIKGKRRIENFFRSGSMPYFLDTEDFDNMADDTANMIEVVDSVLERTDSLVDGPAGVGKGLGDDLEAKEREVAMVMKEKLESLATVQQEMSETTLFFLDSYNAVMDTVKNVKIIHFQLMKFKAKADAIIKLLTGPKQEPTFPQQMIKNCDQDCGNWPISDGYPEGVRVSAYLKQEIFAPGNAIAYRMTDHILLQFTDDAVKDYSMEVYHMNVTYAIKGDGDVLCAGDSLGTANRSPCAPNHLHVVMRKKGTTEPVDPRSWLRAPAPLPKWKQVCNERKLVVLGITLDAGTLAGSKDKLKNAKERAKQDMKAFANKEAKKVPPYRPKEASAQMNFLMAKRMTPKIAKKFSLRTLLNDNDVNIAGDLPEASVDKYALKLMLEIMEIGGKMAAMGTLNELVDTLVDLSMSEGPLMFADDYNSYFLRETLETGSIAASRGNLATALRDHGITCPNILGANVAGRRHYCILRGDCKRARCGAELKYVFQRILVEISFELKSCDINDGITLNIGPDITRDITADFTETIDVPSGVFGDDITTSLEVTVVREGDAFVVSVLSVICNTASFSCLDPEVLFSDMYIAVGSDCATAVTDVKAVRERILSLKIKEFVNEINAAALDQEMVLNTIAEIRSAIYTVIRTIADPPCGRGEGEKEKLFAGGIDFCIKGKISPKPIDKTFFEFSSTFMAGPVPLKLSFGAGGSLGVDLGAKLCILSMKVKATVTPWFGAKVFGSAAINLGFAEGGIKLTGFVMETRLPGQANVGFAKFPLSIMGRLDLVLIPLKLTLSAYASLNLIIKKVKVFEANIWFFAMPAITATIFGFGTDAKDNVGPSFKTVDVNFKDKALKYKANAYKTGEPIEPISVKESEKKRKKRQVATDNGYALVDGCSVVQIAGRAYDNPGYQLSVLGDDDVSKPFTEFAIGTFPGAEDIKPYREMNGATTQMVEPLKDGVPLHFTVRLTDDFGNSNLATCSLDTYDMTLPKGATYWFPVSSNPYHIRANLEVYDDSYLVFTHRISLGYGVGPMGDQVRPWKEFEYNDVTAVNSGPDDAILAKFADPRPGRLSLEPVAIIEDVPDPEGCAANCEGIQCMTFDWDSFSGECLLHQAVVTDRVPLRESRKFETWQRLALFDSWWFEFNDLEPELMIDGKLFIVNAHITDVMGYESYLGSAGTLLDFSPPEPGLIGNTSMDEIVVSGCDASIMQRCYQTTDGPNHRMIIDGLGAFTVFNGNTRYEDTLYTPSNHYISVNFGPFEDKQSGIGGYAWRAGTEPCGLDVFDYVDPHAHLLDPSMWTNQGLKRELQLPDDKYYISVQAVNGIVHGGSLVTSLCHYMPLAVDTEAPIFYGIDEIVYDQYFNAMVIYYNITDAGSGIASIDFGLGRTKHDVEVRKYVEKPLNDRSRELMMFGEYGVDIPDGIPVWIKLRAVDYVELVTSASSSYPIMVDSTPPVAGVVMDGDVFLEDVFWQSSNASICVQWLDFFDPETGISRYLWGVGTSPGEVDVVPLTEYSHREYTACIDAELEHLGTYYSTILAFNRGLNQGCINATSDGITVDVTPPTIGEVYDGIVPDVDKVFTSFRATVAAHWFGFEDPESAIGSQRVTVLVNDEVEEVYDVEPGTEFIEEHTYNHNHRDTIEVLVEVTNGARVTVMNVSTGMLVDLTPPKLVYLTDTADGKKFQANDNSLTFGLSFEDPETDVKEYRLTVYEFYGGEKTRFYPTSVSPTYELIIPTEEVNGTRPYMAELTGLSLTNGALYAANVVAVNNADLSSPYDSEGVIIDATPPTMVAVKIGVYELEENVDPDDPVPTVYVADTESLQASWLARDYESGILNYMVAIGTSEGDTSITGGFIDFGITKSAQITGINMPVTADSGDYYYVTVYAQNGAKVVSSELSSKRVRVLNANKPGVIYDGRDLWVDADEQFDFTSVAVSFGGFESELCGIVGFKWGIGNIPGNSDLLAYTDAGIVTMNDTHAIAQANIEMPWNSKVFVDVVAITGHNCHEDMIVSASDGFWVDVRRPVVELNMFGEFQVTEGTIPNDVNYFQSMDDTMPLRWVVTDQESGYRDSKWVIGSYPRCDDLNSGGTVVFPTEVPLGEITLGDGDTLFATIYARDYTDNVRTYVSAPLTIDPTPPDIVDFDCHQYLSHRMRTLRCTWTYNNDNESPVTNVLIGIGTAPEEDDIYPKEKLNFYVQHWHTVIPDEMLDVGPSYFITLRSYNTHGLDAYAWHTLFYDLTDPVPGDVYVVTTSVPGKVEPSAVLCQESQTHVIVTWTPFGEDNSVIDKYTIAVGVGDDPVGLTGDFIDVPREDGNLTTLYDLDMPADTRFYVTLRGYNLAGLYSTAVSDVIVVSPNPTITVLDGYDETGNRDSRYTMTETQYRAKWFLSDSCPLVNVTWRLLSLDETVVLQPDTPADVYKDLLFADTVFLEKDKTYVALVFAEDVIGRQIVGRSNAVTVYLEKPLPRDVRDGSIIKGEDFNYQAPVDTLSCNWDEFGEPDSDEPGQQILHYKVALGNDPSTESGRSSLKYYINVGLNTSYTFTELALARKTMQYFCTVCATSLAESQTIVSSNGIFAGFRDEMNPAPILVPRYYPRNQSLEIAWEPFDSDFPIIIHELAITSTSFKINHTLSCDENIEGETFEILDWVTLARDNSYEATGIDFIHGHDYYVVVLAKDYAAHCSINISDTVTIDLTPPIAGNISVGKKVDDLIYIFQPDQVHISWEGFEDHESGIESYYVGIQQMPNCETDDYSLMTIAVEYKMIFTSDTNNTFLDFTSLALEPLVPYYVEITARNRAGLDTGVWSDPIFLDATPPIVGDIKDGPDFEMEEAYTNDPDNLYATLTLVHTPSQLFCEISRNVSFVGEFPEDWKKVNEFIRKKRRNKKEEYLAYLRDMGEDSSDGYVLNMKQDAGRKRMQGPAIIAPKEPLYIGPYTIVVQAVPGEDVITSFTVSAGGVIPEQNFEYPIVDNPVDEEFFQEGADEFDADPDSGNATVSRKRRQVELNETESIANGTESSQNVTEPEPYNKYTDSFYEPRIEIDGIQFGFGVSILGQLEYSENGKGNASFAMFWTMVDGLLSTSWTQLQFDPTLDLHTYTMKVDRVLNGFIYLYDVTLIIDGLAVSTLSSLQLYQPKYQTIVDVWNNLEHYPTIKDPFKLYEGQGLLTQVVLPIPRDQLCHFGQPFMDFESDVDELWVGIASNNTFEADIMPMHLYHSVCHGCYEACNRFSCVDNCTQTELRNLVQIHLDELDLVTGEMGTRDTEDGPEDIWKPAMYYILVEMFNRANQSVRVITNGIVVDVSPPVFNLIDCMDPWFSMSEPAIMQASNVSMGAVWDFEDKESNILNFKVAAATMDEETGELVYINNMTEIRHTEEQYIMMDLSLEQDMKYYYVVVAENGAHLMTTASCNITVNMLPPTIDAPPAEPEFTDEVLGEDFPGDVAASTDDEAMGIGWDPEETKDCFNIEWQVSSNEAKLRGNVFPRNIVGPGAALSEIKVEGGNLIVKIAGQLKIMNLGEFAPVDWENLTSAEYEEQKGKSAFKIEMGKCVVHEMFCVNEAHLDQHLKDVVVCNKRTDDATSPLPAGETAVLGSDGASAKRRRKKRQTDPISVEVPPTSQPSAITFGILNEEDLALVFDSAAAENYQAYIQNPVETHLQVSRLMWNRIQRFMNVSFFLSPGGDLWLEDPVLVDVLADYETEPGEEVNILYWDNGLVPGMWTHCAESCGYYPNLQGGRLQAEICTTLTMDADQELPEPPTEDSYFFTNTMFTVVVQLDKPQNDPPELVTDDFVMNEDEELVTQLVHYDTADDMVKWYIEESPSIGHASISESGVLYYQPARDQFGSDSLSIRMIEYGLPDVMTPMQTVASINITIEAVEDPPYLLILHNSDQQALYRASEEDLVVEARLAIENSAMVQYGSDFLALVTLFDPDEDSEMEIVLEKQDPATGMFVPIDSMDPTFVLENYTLSNLLVNDLLTRLVLPQLTWFSPTSEAAWMIRTDQTNGIHAFRVLGKDQTERYSTQFIIVLGIMQNPCVHGYCVGPEDDPNCTDFRRTESFDGYSCGCSSGYSGEICDQGCDCMAVIQTCVPIHECSPWGVCREVSYDCVLDMMSVYALAGGGGGVLLLVIFLVILILCCKFMPSLRKDGTYSRYSNEDYTAERAPRNFGPVLGWAPGYNKGYDNAGFFSGWYGSTPTAIDKQPSLPRMSPMLASPTPQPTKPKVAFYDNSPEPQYAPQTPVPRPWYQSMWFLPNITRGPWRPKYSPEPSYDNHGFDNGSPSGAYEQMKLYQMGEGQSRLPRQDSRMTSPRPNYSRQPSREESRSRGLPRS